MSNRVKLFLFFSGFWIFFAFGFRLYILWVRWGTYPFRHLALTFALVFLVIGAFLVFLGRLGNRAKKGHYFILLLMAIFMIAFWTYRLLGLVLYPEIDPNPRAHLHLSATFLVVGVLLLKICFQGGRLRKS